MDERDTRERLLCDYQRYLSEKFSKEATILIQTVEIWTINYATVVRRISMYLL